MKCKRKVPEGARIEGADKPEYDYLETVQFVCEPYKVSVFLKSFSISNGQRNALF